MKNILDYIIVNYNPNTIILYGSYANGTNNKNSDFDVLIISDNQVYSHDSSIVSGIQLDLFIYPTSTFDTNLDVQNFIQIFDGIIIHDEQKKGAWLKGKVNDFINSIPFKSYEENLTQLEWCEKMLLRVERDDLEGFYRWHWVLVDSLEIYCDICSVKYFGPKKTLTEMKNKNIEAYQIYGDALKNFTHHSLSKWIAYLKILIEQTI